jgi:hypothetical protein
MAEVAQSAHHDFWQPPLTAGHVEAVHGDVLESCERCGTEFMVSSRFCHACGAERADHSPARVKSVTSGLLGTFGLSTPAYVAFVIGVLCVLGALGVGVIFSARTIIDWQAVQLWRIEWLLGAVAAFIAGCLLKKS